MAYESSSFSLSVKDYSKEISTTHVNVALITAANLANRITARDAFLDAIEDVINGTIQDSALALDKKFNTTAPSAPSARRETKLLVVMEDSTTMERYTFTIPCFDISKVTMIPGTDRVDPTDAAAAALITATNAFVLSPRGNAGTVVELVSVGRNL